MKKYLLDQVVILEGAVLRPGLEQQDVQGTEVRANGHGEHQLRNARYHR